MSDTPKPHGLEYYFGKGYGALSQLNRAMVSLEKCATEKQCDEWLDKWNALLYALEGKAAVEIRGAFVARRRACFRLRSP